MFGAFDGKFADCVVVDHLWNTTERLTELSEDKPTVAVHYLHVHETTSTPTHTHTITLVCARY